jgi:lambda repressor-like predicted transcriptional regulator
MMECRLKEAMDGRTIRWLSERSGVHRNTLSSYLKGNAPQLDKAYKIAFVLNKSVYDIWPPE